MEAHARDVDNALDLVEKLMHPESTRRITPRAALDHPFLKEPDEPSDDEFAPHLYGQGVCGKLHGYDEDGMYVKVHKRRRKGGWRYTTDDIFGSVGSIKEDEGEEFETRPIVPGEGVAIGKMPCEFHREGYGFDLI